MTTATPRTLRVVACGMTALSLAACASLPEASKPALPDATMKMAVFVLVPHAEIAPDDPDDPSLSPIGHARAQALKRQLEQVPLAAIYVDEFRRTRQTAMPTLDMRSDIKLSHYFSREPLVETAHRWRQQARGGSVLVIGEPEAIAPLASGLCECAIKPLSADQADRMIRITLTVDGQAHVQDLRYGDTP